MIEVKNVVKSFGGFHALDEATMTVPDGGVYGLVGPNGAGKSTIIRHITGIYRGDSGEVLVDGQPIYENPEKKALLAAIPDDWYYFPAATVKDMMQFYRGFYPHFDMERYEKFKEVFGFGADGSRVIAVNATWWDCEFQNRKPITNYDRIISKTPEELAEFLFQDGDCPPERMYPDSCPNCDRITLKVCYDCWIDWLKQEVTD